MQLVCLLYKSLRSGTPGSPPGVPAYLLRCDVLLSDAVVF
jgi:hypothetical protein